MTMFLNLFIGILAIIQNQSCSSGHCGNDFLPFQLDHENSVMNEVKAA